MVEFFSEALWESERRFRALISASAEIVWTADAAGRIVEDSPSWRAFTGQTFEEWQGSGWLEAIHPDDREEVGALWHNSVQDGSPIETEYRLRHASGEWRWTHVRAVPLQNGDGSVDGWVGMNTDVTARKRAESELRAGRERFRELSVLAERRAMQLQRLAARLTQAEQFERRRIAAVLHDHVQQLLLGAHMHVGIAIDEEGPFEQRSALQRAMEVIQEATQACRSLAVELTPPVLHERGLAPGLEWLAERMRQDHGLTVEITAEPDTEPASRDLRELLFQIVRELLLNVVKHARTDRAWVHVGRRADKLQIGVCDGGAGFDPLPAEAAGVSSDSWGVFHARERLEQIGGELLIESEPERGTRVVATVPADLGATQTEPEWNGVQPGAENAAGSVQQEEVLNRADDAIRVLLVDDHQSVREGLAALIDRQPDLEVIGEAPGGRIALDVARDLQPDVVLMDINLPDLNGIEATRQITAISPRVRVIGLSVHEPRDMARAMLEAGATAYLSKQVPGAELLDAIRAAARAEAVHCSPVETPDG